MGVVWAGSYKSRRPFSGGARVTGSYFRRLPVRDRGVRAAHGAPVVFSEWRGVLETLAQLPQVATEGSDCIAVRMADPSAALISRLPVGAGFGSRSGSHAAAVATAPRADVRGQSKGSASSAGFATPHGGA